MTVDILHSWVIRPTVSGDFVLRQGVDLVMLKEEVDLVLQLVVILVQQVEELALE